MVQLESIRNTNKRILHRLIFLGIGVLFFAMISAQVLISEQYLSSLTDVALVGLTMFSAYQHLQTKQYVNFYDIREVRGSLERVSEGQYRGTVSVKKTAETQCATIGCMDTGLSIRLLPPSELTPEEVFVESLARVQEDGDIEILIEASANAPDCKLALDGYLAVAVLATFELEKQQVQRTLRFPVSCVVDVSHG